MTQISKRSFIYAPPSGFTLVHKDQDILVLEKPAGLLSVPGRNPQHRDCLSIRVQNEYPDALIIHRLDMATSGLILMAGNEASQRFLNLAFETRNIKKHYIADVSGVVKSDTGVIQAPLISDWPNRPRQIVDFDHGRPSETRFEVLNRFPNHTRLLLTPVTGRTHQLRVHMQYIGHPILGDEFYAHDAAYDIVPRLHLHATSLAFAHPQGHDCCFTSDCPF